MAVTARTARRDNPWLLAAIIAVGVLVIAAAAWAFVNFVMDAMRGSEPYRHGLAAAQSDAQVVAALGSPIEAGTFFEGNISVAGQRGDARFAIPIRGPRSAAMLRIVARRDGGPWKYPSLEVRLPDDRAIDLEPAQP